MRHRIVGLVAGVLLIFCFSAPASASTGSGLADPITFTFTDGCAYVDVVVTNNSTGPVDYALQMVMIGVPGAMDPVSFTLPAAGTKTHRWLVRMQHGIQATSPVLSAPILHQYQAPNGDCGPFMPLPRFFQDCHGTGLVRIPPITHPGLGNLVLTRNAARDRTLAPGVGHEAFFSGLRHGDKITLQVPAVTEPYELTTWYVYTYEDNYRCAEVPPVTVTPTCTGINVKTVNTKERSELRVVSPGDRTYSLAQGEALNVDLPMNDGEAVVIWWFQPWDMAGPKPAVALFKYAKPQECAAAPAPGNGGNLPTTGAPTWMLASAGGLLLIIGVVLFGLTRRRRFQSTSTS